MRAGSKLTNAVQRVRVQLPRLLTPGGQRLARAFGVCLTLLGGALGSPGCKSPKLCDDGACERPSDWPASEADAALGGSSTSKDAAPGTAADAAHFDAGDIVTRPCGADGSCLAGGVCHPDLGVCVACVSSTDCESPQPLCAMRQDPRDNACVGCLNHADCDDGACVDDVCVACEPGSNVGCDAPTPHCATGTEGTPVCVECDADGDCSDPARPVCDRQMQQCVLCLTDGSGCSDEQRCVVAEADSGREALRRCVECTAQTADVDCRADTPYCVSEQCAACDPASGAGCDGERPFCRLQSELDVDAGGLATAVQGDAAARDSNAVCAQCRTSADCTDGAECIGGECAECTRDGDCKSPEASACDLAIHQCVPCSLSGQCEHIDGAMVCHGGDSDAGSARCVECDATNSSACGNGVNVCSTLPGDRQYTCTDRTTGQVGFCGECAADADCSRGQRCVGLTAPSGQAGYYCAFLAGASGAPPSCADASAQPFIRAVEMTSVDGVSGTYCTLDTTSCDVYGHFKDSCTSDGQCGAVDDGAWCDLEGDSGRCSYLCEGDGDCPQPGGDCVNGRCDP